MRGLTRREAMYGVIGAWGLLSLARLSRIIEPAEPRPGQEVEPMLQWLRTTIPSGAGYLYVLPGAFGTGQDTGAAPRLRYELYPRPYDDVRASEDESQVQRLILAQGLRYVVVPDARQYAAESWLRQPRTWLRRINFAPDQYVLQVIA
jgi:hypothetical protein